MFHVSKAILWPCTKVIFWPVLRGLSWWLPLTPHTPYNILCSPGPCSCHLEPRTTTLADLQWQVKVIPLIYIWYTQRSTTQPINIQGKFNPLNNTKYRIIIYLLLCHWLIQRGVKLFLDAARVDLMQYMYCFWLIIYIDMWPKWTYICQHTKRNLNWESLII